MAGCQQLCDQHPGHQSALNRRFENKDFETGGRFLSEVNFGMADINQNKECWSDKIRIVFGRCSMFVRRIMEGKVRGSNKIFLREVDEELGWDHERDGGDEDERRTDDSDPDKKDKGKYESGMGEKDPGGEEEISTEEGRGVTGLLCYHILFNKLLNSWMCF